MTGHATACQAPWAALVVDDDAGVRQSLRLCLEAAGARVLGVATGRAALEALDRGHFDVVFLDLWLGPEAGMDLLPEMLQRQEDLGVIVVTAFATIESAVDAVKRGAVDYIPKPFTPDQIRLTANRVLEAQRLRRRLTELQEALDETGEPAVFESHSQTFRQFLQTAGRAAASDAVVLLRGESGTGKNLLARWLRANSPRAEAPFATVNCPALSGDLMTSALFGHRKGRVHRRDRRRCRQGAGSGRRHAVPRRSRRARRRMRRLGCCGFSTTGPTSAWAKRGSGRPMCGLIAATNRRLEDEVKAGRFREDLFYRLNVITLTVPALRERPEDIPLLAQHYLTMFSRKQATSCARVLRGRGGRDALAAWPGNLRELRNAVERAVILAPGTRLTAFDLGLSTSQRGDRERSAGTTGSGWRARLAGGTRTRAHRSSRRRGAVARSRRPHARHRRDDASTQAETIRFGLDPA